MKTKKTTRVATVYGPTEAELITDDGPIVANRRTAIFPDGCDAELPGYTVTHKPTGMSFGEPLRTKAAARRLVAALRAIEEACSHDFALFYSAQKKIQAACNRFKKDRIPTS